MPIKDSKIDDSTTIHHKDLVNVYSSKIGRDCSIATFVEIGGAVIGDGCRIGKGVYICPNTVLDGKNFIAPHVVFCNVMSPRAFIGKKDQFKGVRVCEGATIGSNSVILPGVTIGKYAFVGAGSVVTKDVAPYSLVVGNPARHVRFIDADANI